MKNLYIPIAHGNYPEDGQEVPDVAFESEEEALNEGDEMVEGEYGLTDYFLREIEVVESERP